MRDYCKKVVLIFQLSCCLLRADVLTLQFPSTRFIHMSHLMRKGEVLKPRKLPSLELLYLVKLQAGTIKGQLK